MNQYEQQLDPAYRPLSAWGYFGLKILFAIPIVGFVFLIVFSISRGNINRRSFARSYWCAYIIIGGIILTVFLIALATGSVAALGDWIAELF